MRSSKSTEISVRCTWLGYCVAWGLKRTTELVFTNTMEHPFWRVARHSSNPDHARPGRSIYPDNQGCMGEAFRQGFSCDESLPANTQGYVSRLSDRWNIPREAIDQLTMRARSIAAFALARPISGKRFAIIVFESVVPARIDGPCRDRFSPEEQASIIQWLETMERFEPKPNEAKQEGF